MKFKTPSKPVVKLAYYADNKLPKNSQNTVGHVLMVPNSGKFFAGNFLKRGEDTPVLYALNAYMHWLFPTFSFEENEKLSFDKSSNLLIEYKQADRPVTNQAIKL